MATRRSAATSITVAQLRAVLALDKGAFSSDLKSANTALQQFDSQAGAVANKIKSNFTNAFKQTATQSTASLNSMAVGMTRQVETIQRSLQKLASTRTSVSISMNTARLTEQLTAVREQLATLLIAPQTIDVQAQTTQAREKIAALQTQLAALKNEAGLEQLKITPMVNSAPALASMNSLKSGMSGLGDHVSSVAGSMATALRNGFSNAFSGVVGLVSGAKAQFDQLIQKAQMTGMIMTAVITAPLVRLGKGALSMGADYQTSMNVLQATTQASQQMMDALDKKAIELGADMTLPATSAKDASDAMLELAKAGISVGNVLNAAKGTLQLAAAGQLDNARAAEIASNALNMFGLQGAEATRIADLLAASANASSAEVDDMGYALTMGGAAAAQAKIPIEDYITALGELANKGIKGEMAGAGFRTMLLRLENPTKAAAGWLNQMGINMYDAQGKMLPLRDLIGQFTDATKHMTDQQIQQANASIFGSRSSQIAFDVLEGGIPAYDAMAKAVNRQGAAADLANARMKGLGGAVEGLKSQVETFVLQESKRFMDTLEGWVRKLADLIPKISELPQHVKDLALGIAIAVAAAGPMLLLISGLVAGIGALLSPIGLLVAGFIALGAAVATNMGGIRDQIIPVFGQIAQFVQTNVLPAVQKLGDWLRGELPVAVRAAKQVIEGLLIPAYQRISTLIEQKLLPAFGKFVDWLQGYLPTAISVARPAIELLSNVTQFLWHVILDYLVPAFERVAEWAGEKLPPVIKALQGAWDELKPALDQVAQALAGPVLDSILSLADSILSVLVLAIQTLTDALHGLNEKGSGDISALGAIIQGFVFLFQVSMAILKTSIDFMILQFQIMGTAIKFVFDNFAPTMQTASNAITGFVNGASQAITSWVNDTVQLLGLLAGRWQDFAHALLEIITGNYSQGMADFQRIMQESMDEVARIHQETAQKIADQARKGGQAAANKYADGMTAGGPMVRSAAAGLKALVENVLSSPSGGVFSAGWNLVSTWGNGLISAGNTVLGKVTEIYNHVAGMIGATQKAQAAEAAAADDRESKSHGLLDNNPLYTGDWAGWEKKYGTTSLIGSGGGGDNGDNTDLGGGGGGGAGGGGSKGKDALTAIVDAAKQWSEGVKAALQGISDTMKVVIPPGLGDQTDKLGQALEMVIGKMQTIALRFGAEGLKAVSDFSDAAGKVFGAFSTAYTFFEKLAATGAEVLDPANRLASLTDMLSQKVVIIMNNLGPRVSQWTEEASAQVGAFADASGKVFGAFSIAFDFFTKLAGTGAKILDPANRLAALTDALSEKVVITMNNLGPRVALWTEDAAALVGQFADASGKVFGAFSTAYDFFVKLADTGRRVLDPGNTLAALTGTLAEKVLITLNNLGPRVALWTSTADTIVSGFADAAGKVFGAFSITYDYFSKIADKGGQILAPATQLASLTGALADKVVITLNNLGPKVALWDSTADAIVSGFADTAGKVFSALNIAWGYFSGMAATGAKVLADASSLAALTTLLAEKVVYILNTLGPAVALWDATADGIVSGFADTAGKVFAALSTAYGLFVQLAATGAKVLAPAGELAEWARTLAEKVVIVLNNLGPAVAGWNADAFALVSGFADTAGKVFGALGTAFDYFSKIAETGADVLGQVDALEGLTTQLQAAVVRILDNLRPLVAAWDAEALTLVGQFADASGKMLGALSTAFDLFAKLGADGGLKLPDEGVIDSLFGALDTFLTAFAARAASWKDKATEDAAKIAANVGTIASEIGKAIDPLLKVLDFKLPEGGLGSKITGTMKDGKLVFGTPQSGMYAFFDALDAFITEFAAQSERWKAKATPQVASIATNIGTVMEGLGKAVDVVAKVGEAKDVDTGQIQGVFDKISAMLDGVKALVAAQPEGFLDKAATFANGLASLFSSLKTATDSAAGITNSDSLTTGLQNALIALQGLMTYMSTTAMGILGDFITKTISMRDTWTTAMDTMAGSTEDMAKRVAAALGGLTGTGGGGGGGGGGQHGQNPLLPGPGGRNPLIPYQERVPPVGRAGDGQHFYGNVLMINGDIADTNMPPAIQAYFNKVKTHKQIRGRGLKLVTT